MRFVWNKGNAQISYTCCRVVNGKHLMENSLNSASSNCLEYAMNGHDSIDVLILNLNVNLHVNFILPE